MKFQFKLTRLMLFSVFALFLLTSVTLGEYDPKRFNNSVRIYLSDIDTDDSKAIILLGNAIYKKQFADISYQLDNLLKKYHNLPLLYKFKAFILYEKGKKQEAFDYLSEQIQTQSNRLEFINIRAQFLLEKEHYESAKEDFNTLLDAGINEASIYENLANVFIKQTEYQEALGYFNKALEIDPKNEPVWYTKSTLEYHLRKYHEAKKSCEQALRINPANRDIHYFYIEILSKFKNKQALKSHLKKAERRFPLDLTISSKLISEIYFPEKKYELAQDLLKQLIKKYPDNPVIYYQLGILFSITNNQKAAIAAYQKTLTLNPKHRSAEQNLARSYLILKDVALAEKALLRAVNKETTDSFAYEKLTQIYLSYKDTLAAEDVILKGLRFNPRSTYLIFEYANILKRRGKYKDAIVAFEEALKLRRNDVEIIGNLGELYRITKQSKKSEAKFLEAIKINPKIEWVRLFYSDLLAQQKRYSEALDQLDFILVQTKNNFYAHIKKAYIFFYKKEYKKSLVTIDKAIALNPKSLNQHIVKGNILLKLGRYEDAANVFSEVLKTFPDSTSTLSNLAHAQLFTAPDLALKNIDISIAKANFNILTLELKLYLSGEYKEIWQFKADKKSQNIYKNIMHLKYDEAAKELELLPQTNRFYGPLKFLLDLNQEDEQDAYIVKDKNNIHPWYAFYLGNFALEKNNFEEAENYFQLARKALPDAKWILPKQAIILQGLKKYQPAIKNLLNYLDKMPDSYWAKIRLAINYDFSKEAEKANQIYNELLKVNPKDAWVLNNLAWLYLTTDNQQIRNLEDALKLALKAVQINANAENLDTLAEAYFQKKNYTKALKAIGQALDIDRSDQDHFKKQKKKIIKAMGKKE